MSYKTDLQENNARLDFLHELQAESAEVPDLTQEITEQAALIAEIRASLVGRVTLANAKAENIEKGYSAYVGEKLIEGVLEPLDLLAITGLTKISVEKVTFSNVIGVVEINHSLGVAPKLALFIPDMTANLTADSYTRTVFLSFIDLTHAVVPTGGKKIYTQVDMKSNSQPYIAGYGGEARMTNLSLGVTTATKFNFVQGIPYTLITMA